MSSASLSQTSDAVQQEQQQQPGHRYDQQGAARGQIDSSLSAYIRVVPSEDHSDVCHIQFHAVAVVSSVCPRGWSIGSRSATGFCPRLKYLGRGLVRGRGGASLVGVSFALTSTAAGTATSGTVIPR